MARQENIPMKEEQFGSERYFLNPRVKKQLGLFIDSLEISCMCLDSKMTQQQLCMSGSLEGMARSRVEDYRNAMAVVLIQLEQTYNVGGNGRPSDVKRQMQDFRDLVQGTYKHRLNCFPDPTLALEQEEVVRRILETSGDSIRKDLQRELCEDFLLMVEGWKANEFNPIDQKDDFLIKAKGYQYVAAGCIVNADKHLDRLPISIKHSLSNQSDLHIVSELRNIIVHLKNNKLFANDEKIHLHKEVTIRNLEDNDYFECLNTTLAYAQDVFAAGWIEQPNR